MVGLLLAEAHAADQYVVAVLAVVALPLPAEVPWQLLHPVRIENSLHNCIWSAVQAPVVHQLHMVDWDAHVLLALLNDKPESSDIRFLLG